MKELHGILFSLFLLSFLFPVPCPTLKAGLQILYAVLIQFINNTATGVIFVTIAYTFTFNNNSLAELSVILTTICCSFAFLTPASSAAAALLHNNIWVTTKDIWKIAPILIAAEIIIATTTIISASKIIYKL